MKYGDLTAEELDFIHHVHWAREHDFPGYVVLACMMISGSPRIIGGVPEMHKALSSASKADFLRAVETLEGIRDETISPEVIDRTIRYIRHEWLGEKGASA